MFSHCVRHCRSSWLWLTWLDQVIVLYISQVLDYCSIFFNFRSNIKEVFNNKIWRKIVNYFYVCISPGNSSYSLYSDQLQKQWCHHKHRQNIPKINISKDRVFIPSRAQIIHYLTFGLRKIFIIVLCCK